MFVKDEPEDVRYKESKEDGPQKRRYDLKARKSTSFYQI
jgi:hypothetical protein